jgi:DNA topoisomerase-1
MEEELDEVAQGRRPWVPIIREFYEPFHEKLEKAEQAVGKMRPPDEPTDELCEKCGRNMVIKLGRFGRFLACPGFPECRNAKSLLVKIGVACPQCGGDLVEKRTKSKRTFYGCATYPACEWTSWSKPVPERCPTCGGIQVEAGRDRLRCLTCSPLPERPAGGTRGRTNGRASTTGAGEAANGNGTGVARRTTRTAAGPKAGARASTTSRARAGQKASTNGRAAASTRKSANGRAATGTKASTNGRTNSATSARRGTGTTAARGRTATSATTRSRTRAKTPAKTAGGGRK